MMKRILLIVAVVTWLGLAAWLEPGGAQAAPVDSGRTSAGQPTPSKYEWWFTNWDIQQKVWPLTEGGGVTVAVLDSGIQASISDLRGAVLPGGDTTGAGSNGETDFDVVDGGHGTAMAVLIAGQGYGGGIVGIAPQAKLLPVNAVLEDNTPPSDLAAGIKFAVNHGAAVINMSIGIQVPSTTYCDPVLQDAVVYALMHNVVLVAGSGDANLTGPGPDEPASCAGVLAVGGIQSDGSLWRYSIQQPYVAVAAPGDNIATLDRNGQLHIDGSGTSASCAMVAAAAALIRSRYPSMPWYQVDQRVIDTALPRGNPLPNDGYGYGIIDIYRAVDAAKYPVGASAPNPVYAKFKAWLSSPEGRPFATQNQVTGQRAVPVGSHANTSGGESSSLPMIVLASGFLAIAAVVLVLVFRSRSKSRRARQRAGRLPIASGHAFQVEMRPAPSLGRPPAEPVQAWWLGNTDSSGRTAWPGGPDEESAFK